MPLLQAALKSSKAFLLAGVSVTATLLALELPYYFLPAAEWSNLKYSTIFLETNVIARQIKRLLLPGETFFQLADEAELYALSGQRPHSRYLGIASFTYAQEGVATRKQAAQELAAAKPDLIVADAISMLLLQKVKDSDILPYLEAHYAPVQKEYLRYLFFVKKGSPLEKRWASGAANFMKSADGSDPDPFVEPSN